MEPLIFSAVVVQEFFCKNIFSYQNGIIFSEKIRTSGIVIYSEILHAESSLPSKGSHHRKSYLSIKISK
jgi:hypothetical protein